MVQRPNEVTEQPLTEHEVEILYYFSCQFLWVTLTVRNP